MTTLGVSDSKIYLACCTNEDMDASSCEKLEIDSAFAGSR